MFFFRWDGISRLVAIFRWSRFHGWSRFPVGRDFTLVAVFRWPRFHVKTRLIASLQPPRTTPTHNPHAQPRRTTPVHRPVRPQPSINGYGYYFLWARIRFKSRRNLSGFTGLVSLPSNRPFLTWFSTVSVTSAVSAYMGLFLYCLSFLISFVAL